MSLPTRNIPSMITKHRIMGCQPQWIRIRTGRGTISDSGTGPQSEQNPTPRNTHLDCQELPHSHMSRIVSFTPPQTCRVPTEPLADPQQPCSCSVLWLWSLHSFR